MRYLSAVILCVMLMGAVYASYDAPPRPKASPDLAEFIIQVPQDVYDKHDYTDRTRIMYNLARFKELYIESTKQIQMLQARTKLLEDRVKLLEDIPVPVSVADVNDVE